MSLGTNPDNPNKDVLVTEPSKDTVSCLRFSPASLAPKTYLAASSWDGEVRIWEVQSSGQTKAVGLMKHEGPALWCDWANDGQVMYSSGCDKKVMALHLPTQQKMVIGSHDEPVKHVFHVTDTPSPCIVSAGWDRKMKFWDMKGGDRMLASVDLPERVYAMHVRGRLCVVGMAQCKIQVYDLRKPQEVYMQKASQLKNQTRCLETFPDQQGFILAGLDGRASIDHVVDGKRKDDFTFKCYRPRDSNSLIYPVNCVSFFPGEGSGVFATAGGDGICNFWDKDSRQRYREFPALKLPVTACNFSADGRIFAYGVGYDWAKGAAEYNPSTMQPYILLHAVQEVEVRGRDSRTGRRK